MKTNSADGKPSPWVWLIPLIILVLSLVAAAIAYPYLPAQIPIHFGIGGADSYAEKTFIFAIALLPALLFVLISAKYRRK